MDNYQVATQLGALSQEVKGLSKTMDDFITTQRVLLLRQDDRLSDLEISRAKRNGQIKGIQWLTTTAFAVATFLGAERIIQLTGLGHLHV